MKSIISADTVYVSFNPVKVCQAIGIEDGRIKLLGTRDEVMRAMGKDVQITDFGDLTVMPGFIDAHMHLDDFGKYLSIIDLRGIRSIGEMQQKIIRSRTGSGWILGHGWDQDLLSEKRWPTRDDLDSAEKARPVFLSRLDLHSAVLNSEALRQMKLEDVFGNNEDLVKDSTGKPTGVVREKVFGYADDWIKEHASDREWEEMLGKGMEEANRLGVTSVGFMSCSQKQLQYLSNIRSRKGLTLRVHVYISSEKFDDLRPFENDDYLRVSGVKAFADGSLGSKTALLSFEYRDDVNNSGEERESENDIAGSGKLAESRGMDIATHAIGDLALDNVLSVYEKLGKKHRIEHASLVRRDQIARIRKSGATLVIQPHFVITDFWSLDRIGKDRAEIAYPFRTLLREGIPMALSTDCPVEMLDPWKTVYAAVTRGTPENIPLGLVSGNECITTAEALHLYTYGSAQALRNQAIGSLDRGKSADLIVLDSDPLRMAGQDLERINVKQTWVGGVQVWPAR